MDTNIFDPVTLTLEFDPFVENVNLAIYFWTVSARAFLFHMSIPCDMTFPWFNYFLINIRASYCTWAYLVTRSSYWYQDIYPCDLVHLWNWPLSGAFVFHIHILFCLNWLPFIKTLHIFCIFFFLPRLMIFFILVSCG